ncbi:MAG TPA: CDC27 family protein [Mucilaginibacter sp.]|jgi:tetratricopeptide (TPR) repeat protein|nr:CDC27 family protein [Mucilaginibacter sp.]
MKSILFFLVIISFHTSVLAQQTTKPDDALLLDYYQSQRFAEAADYLKKTYPEPITEVKALSSLAYASAMAGRLPEADDYYQRLYAKDTTNTAILFSLGSINARRGDNLKALSFYKKILLRDSTNFNVYKQMATLSRSSGNFGGAIMYFQKANKLNPVEPDVAYDLGTFYINLKLYKKADTIVTTALQADTANLLLLYVKAEIDYRLDKFPETVTVCNKLMQAGDQNSVIINMLGTCYYKLKSYNNCISTFKLLEESKTSSETSYYYTAMSYKALGKQAEAVNYFDKAIKEAISANANSYYSEMADSFDKMHQLKSAANAYQKSLLYGVMPLTYYALANLYDNEMENKNLALKYYKKYLKSRPVEGQKPYVAYAERRVRELGR